MRTTLTLLFLSIAFYLTAQISFSDETDAMLDIRNSIFSRTEIRYNGGIAIGITDLNEDNKDDIVLFDYDPSCGEFDMVVLHQGPYVTGYGIFNAFKRRQHFWHTLSFPGISDVKGVAIADIDNTGESQVAAAGAYNDLKIYNPVQQTDQTLSLSTYRSFFIMQGINFVDISGDNELDLFACNDNHMSEVFRRNGPGFISDFTQLKPAAGIQQCPSIYPDHSAAFFDPNSGNYGSVFADIDFDPSLVPDNFPELYISKCRGGVSPTATTGCTINQLFQKTTSTGVYNDVAGSYGLDDLSQSWASDFGDIDNDGDLDLAIINHSHTKMRILSNPFVSGSGVQPFIDITTSAIATNITDNKAYQVFFEDFDNDGYLDLLISNRAASRLYHNNGNQTFTEVSNWLVPEPQIIIPPSDYHTPNGFEAFGSCATGDLNHDGFIDIYATYGGFHDLVWINEGGPNNYVKIRLVGDAASGASNKDGIGARLHLEHTSGSLGTQVREVRSGESYGVTCSLIQNFGLAQNDISQFTLTVYWPSGQVDVIPGASLNMNDVNVITE